MLPGPQGLEPAPDLESRLRPLLQPHWQQDTQLVFTERHPLLDSSAMQPRHWFELAAELRDLEYQADAFILIQGTDTLAWTASALECLLPDFSRPLLLTASQRPLGQPDSDALPNLVFALQQAVQLQPSIQVAFAGQCLPPSRTRKFDSQGLQAFMASGPPPLERRWPDQPALNSSELRHLAEHFSPRLLRLPLTPGLADTWLASHLQDLDGLILEGLGSGNAPPLPALAHQVALLKQQGIATGLISQCWQGGITQDYAAASQLHQAGVINLGRMTPEAAETRLTCLLALVHLGHLSFAQACDFWPDESPAHP